MKIVHQINIAAGYGDEYSRDFQSACDDAEQAIRSVDWPHGTGAFRILPEKHANGVVPIKRPCIKHLQDCGWKVESLPPIGTALQGGGANRTGDLDALKNFGTAHVGFEWETGNISSSHRAVNKLLLALTEGDLMGGILVLPTRALAKYLTDRIGNFEELRPYFKLFQRYPLPKGSALRVFAVEHDATDPQAPRIGKGTDGRARG